MSVGDARGYLEATYPLRGDVPQGAWGMVGDGIVFGTGAARITVRFEVRRRPAGGLPGDDSRDLLLASAQHTFVRDTTQPFSAVPFSATVPGLGARFVSDDLLVYRFVLVSGDTGALYVLNGDGQKTSGQIPHLDLPK